MNERNVEALKEIFLRVHLSRTGMGSEVDTPHAREVCRGIAEGLAAAGVLVPSALTPQQMQEMGEKIEREMAGSGVTDPEAHAESVRILERIAKGEAIS